MVNRQLDEEEIFHVARKISDTEALSKYLDQICAGDQALRERVEALLDIHGREENFLKSLPESAATVDHTSLTERPGDTVGRYKLMEQIGEGGMGAVFVAEQERPIRRKVALKVIKPGMDSKAVVARFEAERQALAMMDHPNIAKVLDAGTTESGRPYFAMELVKGVPISEYCDRHRLAIRERLALFIQVCHAIQHAHQKGIIHRDIKPSNVLVTLHDGRPVPKVIDFGVAKALNARLTDKTIYTEHLQIVGTLLYMSPEQAELSGLDVDTRSDIYSLGVLLYELLTGTTPFQKNELDKAGFDEQRRIIREREPIRLSVRVSSLGKKATRVAEHRNSDPKKLNQLLQGDLDWIVLKALEKDRTRRFETANTLAADIERHLKDEPVEARPPSALYRFRKFARRNKTGLAVSIIAAVSLITGLLLAIGRNRELAEAFRRLEAKGVELQEANRQLTATLKSLRDELLDRAFGDALAGDALACEYSLTRAMEAGAEEADVLVFRALANIYGGQLTEAVRLLENARSIASDNLAVLHSLAVAYFYIGEIQKGTEVSDRIAQLEVEGHRPRGDYERLLVAFNTAYMLHDVRPLITELDDIVSRHPRWGIAYAIRAEAKTQLAKNSRQMDDLEAAREDATRAARYQPDNAFVLSSGMHAWLTSIELARHEGVLSENELKQLETKAAEIETELARSPNYYHGMIWRLHFLRLMNREQEYQQVYRNTQMLGYGKKQAVIAEMLVGTDARREIQEYLASNPDSFAAQTAMALLNILEGGESSAEEALTELADKFTNLNQRWLMLDVALASQDQALARRLAKKSLNQLAARKLATISREDQLMTEFYAGAIDADTLLEKCGPFKIEGSVGHYAIGMWQLAGAKSRDDLEGVKKHLAIAADCPAPGWWHIEFARAYLQLIEDGRLPQGFSKEPGE
jgi:serine/threonine protein kinase